MVNKTRDKMKFKIILLVLLLIIVNFTVGSNTNIVTTKNTGYASISSSKLYYEIIGKGFPIILLHGGLGPGGHFDNNISELLKHFQIIQIHTRGHGKSYDNDQPFSYSSFAEDIYEVLDVLKIDSAYVIGFSDGGVTAYHLASKYPDKIKKVIAVGANYLVEGLTKTTNDWIYNSLNSENIIKNLPEIKNTYVTLNPNPDNFDQFINKTKELWLRNPYIKKENLEKITIPILLIAGDSDAININHLFEMHELIKTSQLCVLPDASHFVLSEKSKIVNQICIDFLK